MALLLWFPHMTQENKKHTEAIARARLIYKKMGPMHCPALGGSLVFFTNAGFNHILRKGRIERMKKDQERRLCLLPYAETVIMDPQATCAHRKIINNFGDPVYFWGLTVYLKDKEVTVVIRQIGKDGGKHFFSIIDARVKKG